MGKDLIKLLLGEGTIEGLILLGKNRMILGHKAEGQTRPELQEQGRQSVQGIINVPREDQVSDHLDYNSL